MNTQEISEKDMLTSWGVAEMPALIRDHGLSADTLPRRNSRSLNSNDLIEIEKRIRARRASLLNGVVGTQATWQMVDLPVNQLGSVRVIDGWDCSDVKDLSALLLRKPEMAFTSMNPDEQFGLPILIGPTRSNLCLVEGTHRCLTVLRDASQESPFMSVIVGTWPNATQWWWWTHNRNRTAR